MASVKRNQIEEAISRVLATSVSAGASDVKNRLKRLLDTDRTLGRTPRSSDPERADYAFYSTEAPGSGMEVWFSEYEAFALLTGLRLMTHGWPQGFAVAVMRRVRRDLEKQHARILRQDPKVLFDREAIAHHAKAGDMALDNRDPTFLTIVSRSVNNPEDRGETIDCAVCRGPTAAVSFISTAGKNGGAGSMFEIVTLTHRLSAALRETKPRSRGR